MELPISPQSYQPDASALVRAIHTAAITLAQTTAKETSIDCADLYVQSDRPGIRAVNFAAQVQPVANLPADQQIQQILDEFQTMQATCEVILPAGLELSASLSAAAIAQGYRPAARQVFLMQGYRRPARINTELQIVPARAIYSQLDAFYQHQARTEFHATDKLAQDFARTMVDFLDDTRLEVFIARLQGKNVACAGVMSLGQIGVIVPAWSDPALRGQGLAGTLMSHVMDLCARALFQQVILDRAEHCPAIGFYESLGFKSVARFVKYRRHQEGSTLHG